jgi:hypothetical protein
LVSTGIPQIKRPLTIDFFHHKATAASHLSQDSCRSLDEIKFPVDILIESPITPFSSMSAQLMRLQTLHARPLAILAADSTVMPASARLCNCSKSFASQPAITSIGGGRPATSAGDPRIASGHASHWQRIICTQACISGLNYNLPKHSICECQPCAFGQKRTY